MTQRRTADGRPRPEGHEIGDLGEDGLIAAVVARYGPMPAGVLVGPGDDAAVLDVAGPVVVSTDTLVEGHDFRRDWSSATDVGVKTAAQNLADVAAMGARPLALVVSLAAGPELPADWAAGFADGLDAECRRAGAAVVGGDIAQSAQVVVTGTAIGVLPGRVVRRSGARPGDVVALAGSTGPSAAGLALLLAGTDPAEVPSGRPSSGPVDRLVTAHRAPQPPYPAGPAAAAAGATAMIDTSDGLLRDAARIAEASGVVLDLDPVALAPDDDLLAAARLVAGEAATQATVERLALEWVLSGGEDHALLACFPPEADLPPPYRTIGRVLAPNPGIPGIPPTLVGGTPWTGPTGWRHFT